MRFKAGGKRAMSLLRGLNWDRAALLSLMSPSNQHTHEEQREAAQQADPATDTLCPTCITQLNGTRYTWTENVISLFVLLCHEELPSFIYIRTITWREIHRCTVLWLRDFANGRVRTFRYRIP